MEWINYAVSILSGLAIAIPLVVKLIEYVKKAIREKNWSQLIVMVMSYMKEAENKFDDGATRKEWVMAMIETSAKTINYDADMQVISALIDSLCNMTKVVNAGADNTKGV